MTLRMLRHARWKALAWTLVALLSALAARARPALAQENRPFGVRMTALALHHTHREPLTPGISFSGYAAGFGGHLSLGRARVGMQYLEGSLSSSAGDAPHTRLVEAGAELAVDLTGWVAAFGGPRATGYSAPGGTHRTVVWRGGLTVRVPVTPGAALLASYAASFAGESNVFGPLGLGGDAEIGVHVGLGSLPLAWRIGYRIERTGAVTPQGPEGISERVLARLVWHVW